MFERAARRVRGLVKVSLIEQHHAQIVLKTSTANLVRRMLQEAKCAAIAHASFVQIAFVTSDQTKVHVGDGERTITPSAPSPLNCNLVMLARKSLLIKRPV